MADSNTYDLKNIVRKILAAFILVSVAIALALVINRYSFRELLGTVNKLSEPNEKLIILNNLFQQITTLDQTQREEAIKNPRKPYQSFLEQSASLNLLIDSLQQLEWDTLQLQKLNEMKSVLGERNELFFRYLKVKADLLDNKDFAVQLDTLTAILKDDQFTMDSSLITRKKTITTTFLRDSTPTKKPAQQSLLKKLFSKKKKMVVAAADTQKVKIEQELSIIKDTAAIARQNEAARDIEKIIRAMESDQLLQRKKLQRQEMELIHANSIFVNQLLSILHDVENDEYHQLQADNHHAVSVMSQSISRTNILMLSFFVAAAVLVYLIWIDIGKSNYYKEQLEKARDEAEELSQIKQRFLANMSHEIRTPLQSIIGFAEQLKQMRGYPGEVDAIYSSSEHLLQIVNEVLDYSRISSGVFTLAKERLDLLRLVEEVGSAMRVQAERKDLELIVNCEHVNTPAMIGDPFRLRQILYNILGNAIKFTHHGSIRLAVKTEALNDRIMASFDITDTGIGMKKEELEKIFNQFEQANLSIARQYGGTGLGLTIVKALVDAQGGTISVDSEPGKGTSFHIELPFEKENALRPSRAVSGAQPETTFHGKVMVVDDDTLILQLCSLILKKNGIAHRIFPSPGKALQHAPDPETSVILLDIRMPGMSGVELCRELRKKYPPQTRFIALTAHVLADERSSLQKDGFDDVLPKPFHEQELLGVLGYTSPTTMDIGTEEEPDLSLLHRMTMNDEALFQSILTQFVEETDQDLQAIALHLHNNDSRALREVVHKMAGRFAQIGMKGLASGLQTLEKKLVAGYSAEMLSTDIGQLSKKIKASLIQVRRSAAQLHS